MNYNDIQISQKEKKIVAYNKKFTVRIIKWHESIYSSNNKMT